MAMTAPRPMTVPMGVPETQRSAVTRTVVKFIPSESLQLKGKRYRASDALIQEAVNEVRSFSELAPNWDSYGGEPPTPQAMTAAEALLVTTQRVLGGSVGEHIEPEYVAPRADGGVQIEWAARSVKVAVEVSATGSLGYLFVDKRSGVREPTEQHDVPSETIQRLIATVLFAVDHDQHSA
jgi:hypothetical protein